MIQNTINQSAHPASGQTSPIEQAVARLSDAIAALDDDLHVLYARLNPYMVVMEKNPQPPQPLMPVNAFSAAAGKLVSMTGRLLNMKDELHVIMEKLEV